MKVLPLLVCAAALVVASSACGGRKSQRPTPPVCAGGSAGPLSKREYRAEVARILKPLAARRSEATVTRAANTLTAIEPPTRINALHGKLVAELRELAAELRNKAGARAERLPGARKIQATLTELARRGFVPPL